MTASNNIASKYLKQKLNDLRREIDKSILVVVIFNKLCFTVQAHKKSVKTLRKLEIEGKFLNIKRVSTENAVIRLMSPN